jgi:transposase IS66 family protein
MRDLDDEVLNRPFDEELKFIAVGFGSVLKPIVETIDRRGLSRHFLRKYMRDVERFYRSIEKMELTSEPALKCRERFSRNRHKLFTFLEYDGVPWNNNNAEHAIKAFARLRDLMSGNKLILDSQWLIANRLCRSRRIGADKRSKQ